MQVTIINASHLLMVVFLVVRVSVVPGRSCSWLFVVPGGVPGHADVINDSSLMVRCSWWFVFLVVRRSAAIQMSSMIVRSWLCS